MNKAIHCSLLLHCSFNVASNLSLQPLCLPGHNELLDLFIPENPYIVALISLFYFSATHEETNTTQLSTRVLKKERNVGQRKHITLVL